MDPKPKWYYSVPAVIVGLLLLGPFSFPILWKSNSFNLFWKILLTVLVLAMTYYMITGTVQIVDYLLREMQALKSDMNV